MSIQDNLGSFPSELPHEVEDLRAEVRGWVEDESQLVSRNHGGVQLEPDGRVGTEQDNKSPSSHSTRLPLCKGDGLPHYVGHQAAGHLQVTVKTPGQRRQHLVI